MQTVQNIDFAKFTDTHIREMEKYNKFEKDKAKEHFDSLAENYDSIYEQAGYPDPKKCTDYLNHYAGYFGLSKSSQILDFACGTGLVGKALDNSGFKNIYGVDISEEMIKQADEKDVYRNIEQLELGQKDFYGTFPPLWRQKFDFVTCCGLITNHHMDENILEQMLLSLKDKGILIFTAQHSFIGQFWYEEKLQMLEKLGRIKLLKSDSFFQFENMPKAIGRFQKTPMKIFAYQKTELDSVMAFKRYSTMTKNELQAHIQTLIAENVKKQFVNCNKKLSGMSLNSTDSNSTDEGQ